MGSVSPKRALSNPLKTPLLRNVEVKLKVNSIEDEGENGIFLFISFAPGQRKVHSNFIYVRAWLISNAFG